MRVIVCSAAVHIVVAQADFPALPAPVALALAPAAPAPPATAPATPAAPASPPAGPHVVGRIVMRPVVYHVLRMVVWFGPWPATLEWLAPIVWAV